MGATQTWPAINARGKLYTQAFGFPFRLSGGWSLRFNLLLQMQPISLELVQRLPTISPQAFQFVFHAAAEEMTICLFHVKIRKLEQNLGQATTVYRSWKRFKTNSERK